jgi:hypothetical protein
MESTHQAPAPAVAEPAVAAPAPAALPALALTPAALLALQRTAGNRAVRAMIARQPTATADEVATEEEALTWPKVLSEAARGEGQELKVTLHAVEKGKPLEAPTLENEDAGGALSGAGEQLTDDQRKVKRIVNFIKGRRKLDTAFLKLTAYKQKNQDAPTAGYSWGGGSDAGVTPTDVKQPAAEGDALGAKRKQAQGWIWEEFSHEGSSISINAYDEARMTWGRGMAASGGHLQSFMQNLPEDVKTEFLKYGIQVTGGAFHVVNVANGAIETGSAALQLMQAHPEVLAAFKVVGEGHRQEIVDAQWKEMKTAAVNVPDTVLGWDWPKPAIQLIAHFHHAGDSYGWGKAQYYKDQGGPDPTALWLAWMKLLAGSAEANGLYLVSSQTHHVTELRVWGGGAALKGLAGASGPLKATKAQLQKADFLSGHVAMILPDAATYYVWPRLTPEQEKSLGGGADREAFKQLNALSMSDMLDQLEGRKADVTRWLGVPDYYVMAGPETNEERIWYAMRVVSTRKLPKRPEGKDGEGNELVPEGQAGEAQEWLDGHKKK